MRRKSGRGRRKQVQVEENAAREDQQKQISGSRAGKGEQVVQHSAWDG